jgi:hypothetical protein
MTICMECKKNFEPYKIDVGHGKGEKARVCKDCINAWKKIYFERKKLTPQEINFLNIKDAEIDAKERAKQQPEKEYADWYSKLQGYDYG